MGEVVTPTVRNKVGQQPKGRRIYKETRIDENIRESEGVGLEAVYRNFVRIHFFGTGDVFHLFCLK